MKLPKVLALNLIVLLVASVVFFSFVNRFKTSSTDQLLWHDIKVGELDLSNLPVEVATARLQRYEQRETVLSFPHRARRITYSDMGVRLKTEILGEYVRECSLWGIYCKPKRPVSDLDSRLVEIDEEKYRYFVNQLNEEIKSLLYSPDISFDSLEMSAHGEGAEITINEAGLRSQFTAKNIISDNIIQIETVVTYPEGNEAQQLATTELVDGSVRNALLIKYGRQAVYIPSETLRSFIVTIIKGDKYVAAISKVAIRRYLDSLGESYPLDIELEKEASVLNLAYALLFRAGGETPYTAVILPLKGESQTNGSYADKYLELNKTQQRMYAFENGKLVRTYIVGTGLTWETPAGNFQILRKEGLAFSYTGGWFMPYYMPIGTIKGYFFGFHEIPYQKTAQGQVTSRNANTMGSPATGGCIQLYRKDAKRLYEWVDLGTPVLIVE